MTSLDKEIKKAIDICNDLGYPEEVVKRISAVTKVAEIEQILYSVRKNLND